MASLFQGAPQTATSYVTTTQEMPKWLQDAIYNQIQTATNIANRPYTPYQPQTFVDPEAYRQSRPDVYNAFMQGGGGDANAWRNFATQHYQQYGYAEPGTMGGTSYLGGNVVGLSPLEQQAYQLAQQNVGAYQPDMSFASEGMRELAAPNDIASRLRAEQAKYLRPELVDINLQKGQQYWDRAGAMDVMGAAQPYLERSAAQDVVGAAQPYLEQAGQTTAESLAERALTAADPYLRASSQTAASQVGQYMSPYQEGVLDVIARQGARNLRENILPNVSDAFIRAGQFGSSRMGEFGSRAARDTQEAILNAQAQALQQGYGQSLQAAQADLARQAQLAGTVGSISGADLSRILQGGAQYGNLGQTAGQLTAQQANILAQLGQTSGQLTSQQMQNLMNLGQMQTGAGQAQQQFGLTAAQQAAQLELANLQRRAGAMQSVADIARQNQALRVGDVASLEAAGQAGRNVQQAAANAMRGDYMAEQLYPQQQLDWLSTQIRGMAPITPQPSTQTGVTSGATYAPSPLSQLATGLYTVQGLRSI